jgi:hypothetical protein
MTIVAGECAQEGDLARPIMETDEDHSRPLHRTRNSGDRISTIVFDDYSTMRVQVAGGPTINTLAESKIESVLEIGTELTLVSEDSGTATLRLAQAGSSVTVKDEIGKIEYAG